MPTLSCECKYSGLGRFHSITNIYVYLYTKKDIGPIAGRSDYSGPGWDSQFSIRVKTRQRMTEPRPREDEYLKSVPLLEMVSFEDLNSNIFGGHLDWKNKIETKGKTRYPPSTPLQVKYSSAQNKYWVSPRIHRINGSGTKGTHSSHEDERPPRVIFFQTFRLMGRSVVEEQELLLRLGEAGEHFDILRIASKCRRHSVTGVAVRHIHRSLPQ